jgi:hypothetical protein
VYAFVPLSTITGATLSLGILDYESAEAGSHSTLRPLLDTQLEAFGGTGTAIVCPNPNPPPTNVACSEYDIYTNTLSGSAFAQLATGNATLLLTLQGPGRGIRMPAPQARHSKEEFARRGEELYETTLTPRFGLSGWALAMRAALGGMAGMALNDHRLHS